MNKKYKLLLIPAFLLIFIGFLSSPIVYGANKFKVLNVPLFGQQTKMWCWAAGGEMIMAYYGEEVPQCEQVNNKLGRSDCCMDIEPGHPCFKGGCPQFGKYGFNNPHSKYGALSWQELVNQIDANQPVGFSWEWKKCNSKYNISTPSHYMVARGYILLDGMKMVVVNDPLPVNPHKTGGGSIKIMAYLDYVNFSSSYTHSYDQYNITKKENIPEEEDLVLCSGILDAAAGLDETSGTRQREEIAAGKSLELIKRLPPAVLEKLGFKSKQETNLSRLGKALKVYLVGLNLLQAFKESDNPFKILEDAGEVSFPVYVDERSISSITVRKRKGGWVFAVVGKKEPLFAEWARLKQDAGRTYFMVQVQELYLTFLAYFSKDKLYLIPTHEDEDLKYPLHEPIPAEKVFLDLKFVLAEFGDEIAGAILGEELTNDLKGMDTAFKGLGSGNKNQALEGMVQFVKVLGKMSRRGDKLDEAEESLEIFKSHAEKLGSFTGSVYSNELTGAEKDEMRTMAENDAVAFMEKILEVYKTGKDFAVPQEMKDCAGELSNFLKTAKPDEQQWLADIFKKSMIESLSD